MGTFKPNSFSTPKKMKTTTLDLSPILAKGGDRNSILLDEENDQDKKEERQVLTAEMEQVSRQKILYL